MKKVIIVGGVATGASCAARLRRLDENLEITLIEKGEYVSYANCGLPYYLGNIIKDENNLLVQTPQSLKKRFNIDVKINSEVTSIDTANNTITINNKEILNYDYLVLAVGCRARQLFLNIPSLRTIKDANNLKEKINKSKTIALIGGGFINIELSENLVNLNKEVTIFEYEDHILPNYDQDIIYYVQKELKQNNVKIHTSARIKDVTNSNDSYTLSLDDGSSYNFDLVISNTGIIPNTEFLKNTDIELDQKGYILTDRHLRTNISNIYAGGDAISCPGFNTAENFNIPLAGPANKQGRIIADNIVSFDSEYIGSLATNIIKVFSLEVASVGPSKKQLDQRNISYQTICIHPSSHASYYPNSSTIHAKLYYETKSLKILSTQAVGKENVDKLIDVISTAITLNGKVTDLARLELCYAPPFNSAKSAANYFGFIAENVENDLVELITVQEALNNKDDILLDVRTNQEYQHSTIPNSIHIPVDDLRERIDELSPYKNKYINAYCKVGIRSYIACRILTSHGYKCRNITGAFSSYQSETNK